MPGKNVKSLVVVLIVCGLVIVAVNQRTVTGERSVVRQEAVASPPSSPVASPAAATPNVGTFVPGTPVDHFPAVVGDTALVPSVDSTWQSYESNAIGVLLRYPPGWTFVETEDRLGVGLYPQGTDTSVPSPLIAVQYFADRAYSQGSVPSDATTAVAITVAGVQGQRYEDSSLAILYQTATIELPHREGTLVITATLGPTVNLAPILEQDILPTIMLLP